MAPPKKAKPDVLPLEKGEVRKALRSTWTTMGVIGLQWRSIARRAFAGKCEV